MINFLFPLLFLLLLVAAAKLLKLPERLNIFLIVGYVVRIILQFFLREIPFFSHGGAGDCRGYEIDAMAIARLWTIRGVYFITRDNLPVEQGSTTLPQNIFGFICYLNGGEPARAGCVAFVAFLAALTVMNFFRLAIEMGAREKIAINVAAVLYLSPSYLFHTSEMFKDGIVAFLMVTAIGSSLRLTRGWAVWPVALGLLSLWGLWYVRYYLIYLSIAPLVMGMISLDRKQLFRSLITVTFLVPLLIIGVVQSSTSLQVYDSAEHTFMVATGSNAREENATGNSGVTFNDGGNAFGAIVPKVLYTLFSPFPWQGGSLGLQIGKIDTLMWYYWLYRAFLGSKILWKNDKKVVLVFLSFLIPCTIAYATTMANIGLILRQRLVIVLMTTLLATYSWNEVQAPAGQWLRGLLSSRRRSPTLPRRSVVA